MVRLALFFAVCLSGWLGFEPAHAQSPRQISFDEAVQIALDQNIALQQAENQAELQGVQVSRARMNFYPDLSFDSRGNQSYGRVFSQDQGSIVNETSQSLGLGVNSNINLFNGFNDVATFREARLNRIAPISQEMVLNYVAEHVLGLPRSY